MTTILVASHSTSKSTASAETGPLTRNAPQTKMSADSVSRQLAAQVVSQASLMTPQQLEQFILDELKGRDLTGPPLTEFESEVLGLLFMVQVKDSFLSEDAGREEFAKLSAFDPMAWQQHISVFLNNYEALQVMRKSMTEMGLMLATLAFNAKGAEAAAIMDAGKAQMLSTLSAAIGAGALSVAGFATTMNGLRAQHANAKHNIQPMGELTLQIKEAKAALRAAPGDFSGPETRRVGGLGPDGKPEVRDLSTGDGTLDTHSTAVFDRLQLDKKREVEQRNIASQLAQKDIQTNIALGAAISSMAQIISAGVAGIIRVSEYAANSRKTHEEGNFTVNSSGAAAVQEAVSNAIAQIGKALEMMQQMVEGRKATYSAMVVNKV